MAGSTDNDKQVAKELTLAVIAKMHPPADDRNKLDVQLFADQVSKVYETIYEKVKQD